MEPQMKISAEERRRLDRQRFIGLQTQKRLLASRVLITPVNGPNTELAKNLVLAGVNVTIFDSQKVTANDIETNFLVAFDELDKMRGEVVFERLKEMNPSGKNQLFLEQVPLQNLEFFEKYTIICTSFTDFKLVKKWDEITKKVNKPYYNLTNVGLYGFAYISLGNQYTYRQITKTQTKEHKIESLTFEECLDSTQILKLRKRKQADFLIAVLMLKRAQDIELFYDPFSEQKFNSEMLKCMVQLGQELKEDADELFLRNFARLYGIDFCPTYSVVGSIISQQIIKVVGNQSQPGVNWLIFNSEQGFANVVKLKAQDEKKISKVIE